MPIEDADRVHSRQTEGTLFKVFGYKITFMKLMTIVGGGIGGLFIIVAAVMFMSPVEPQLNITENITPPIDTTMSFTIVQVSNFKVIQISYTGTKIFTDIKTELSLSMNPPLQSPYIQRQIVESNKVSSFNSQLNKIYIYTGIDNNFHASYTLPKSENCVDFVDGDWSLNIDDGKTHTNLYKFKFIISNSTTEIIKNSTKLSDILLKSPDYSTLFIYSGIYKERLSLTRPTRLIGIGNPIIDAGGYGAGISISSSNNIISGLTITNSGIKNVSDGGIVIINGNNNVITKNHIYKTIYGIWLSQSNNNTISNNTIYNNDNAGMRLTKSGSNIITNNIIYNNVYGIYADSASNLNTIKENNLYLNKKYGVLIDNYKNLQNICEYNIYSTDKMSCSDSINRDQIITTTTNNNTSIKTTVTYADDEDNWSDCENNPKCYQS